MSSRVLSGLRRKAKANSFRSAIKSYAARFWNSLAVIGGLIPKISHGNHQEIYQEQRWSGPWKDFEGLFIDTVID